MSLSSVAVALDAEIALRVKDKRAAEYRVAVLLGQVQSGKHYREFGYSKLSDYAADRHGLSVGQAKGLAQIGQKLAELPLLDQAMADGALDWTKARQVARIATAETEGAWLELARVATSRALEDAARSSQDGLPPAEGEVEDRVPVVFWVSRVEAEHLRVGLQALRATCGGGTEGVEDGRS